MNIVIISGGNVDTDFALCFLEKHKADTIMAVDRGLEFCYKCKIRPAYAVGDFDSADPQIVKNYLEDDAVNIHRLRPEKDDSDTESALHLAARLGAKKIWILGGTGTRLDHVIANLQLLVKSHAMGIETVMADANNEISIHTQSFQIRKEERFGKYVSFFAWSEQVSGLTLEGFRYPLKDFALTNQSCGLTVSNEIEAEIASVTFTDGILVMIMSKD